MKKDVLVRTPTFGEAQPGDVRAPIWNEYGTPCVYLDGEKCFFSLSDHGTDRAVEVSEEFYNAFVREFGEENDT